MIKPRTIDKAADPLRPTLPQPKSESEFAGWGPRLRY
jgi:hypothetical protein